MIPTVFKHESLKKSEKVWTERMVIMNESQHVTYILLTLHECRKWVNETTVLTWCGRQIDITAETIRSTDSARSAGILTEVSCPLCQAAQIIDATRITLPSKNHDCARQPPEQPMFEGAESW